MIVMTGRGPVDVARVRCPRDLAPLLDHTVLGAEASSQDVLRACDEAIEHGFAGVCVREVHVAVTAARLRGRLPLCIAVADFPRGRASTPERVQEVRRLLAEGAQEIDVVFPLPLVSERRYRAAFRDLEALVEAAGPAPVKVILETGALSGNDRAAACAIAVAAGAAYVKTSTGFGPRGATEDDVAVLRAIAGAETGVKASGGIRTAGDALRMVRAGASRIGASGSVAIVQGTF
jgi:deoxyribose-phosphate aldolase